MGILKHLFMAPPVASDYHHQDFLCDTCGDVLDDPTVLDPCEHIICKSCLGPKAATSTKAECPVDRCGQQMTGQKEPPRSYMELLNNLTLAACPFTKISNTKDKDKDNRSGGGECFWRGELGELATHRKVCDLNPNNSKMQCIKGCGALLLICTGQFGHDCVKYLKEEVEATMFTLKRSRKQFKRSEEVEEERVTTQRKSVETENKLKTTQEELVATQEVLKSIQEALEDEVATANSAKEKLEVVEKKLKTTEEDLKASNKALKLTQEELKATNEILKTTKEELQVSKDELNGSRKRARDPDPVTSPSPQGGEHNMEVLHVVLVEVVPPSGPSNGEEGGASDGLVPGKRVRQTAKISSGSPLALKLSAKRQQQPAASSASKRH